MGLISDRAIFGVPQMPLVIAGVVVLLIAAYFLGREHGLERYYNYKSSVEAEAARWSLEVAKRAEATERVTTVAETGWDAARADIARAPGIRVRNTCPSSDLPAVPPAASKPDEAPVEPRPDTEVVLTPEQCEARVINAVHDAAQLVWLQEWVTQVREATK